MTLHYAGENYGIAREPVVQSESTRSGNQKLSTMERGGQKDGDCNLLGFVPALRFLRSQILCKLYKSPSDETINGGPPCVYTCTKITYAR